MQAAEQAFGLHTYVSGISKRWVTREVVEVCVICASEHKQGMQRKVRRLGSEFLPERRVYCAS